MTGKALIDALYSEWYGVEAPDANNATIRAIILRAIQRAVRDYWEHPGHHFKYASGTVTIASSTASGSLPATFAGVSDHTEVYTVTNPRELEYLQPDEFFARKRLSTATASRPTVYTIAQEPTAGAAQTMWVHPGPAANITVQVDNFLRQVPTIVDATNDTGLAQLPVDQHGTLIYDGSMGYLMESNGDGREMAKKTEFKRALAKHFASISPMKNAQRRPPRYGARRISV